MEKDLYDDSGSLEYKGGKGRVRAILIGVVILLIIICAIFIALFAIENIARRKAEKEAGRPSKDASLCDTKECLYAALDVLQQLNQSVDPCDNFYDYACGGWLEQNQLKEGQTYKTGFSIVSARNYNVLKKAIESSWMTYGKNEAVMKAAKFYNSCINAEAVETRGDQPLKEFIRYYGSWHVTAGATGNVTGLFLKRLAKINRELGKKPLFSISVTTDPHNSTGHILYLRRAHIGMSRDYYVEDTENNLKVRQAYKQYMKDVVNLIGAEPGSDKEMDEVYAFEAKIAQIETEIFYGYTIVEHLQKAVPPGTALPDLRITLEQLAVVGNTSLGNFSLSSLIEYFQDVFQEQGYKFSGKDLIFAYPPTYHQKLMELYINQTIIDANVLDNYAMWSAISNVIFALPSNYTAAYVKYLNALVGKRSSERWKVCLSYMQGALKMPLALLFVDKAFDDDKREKIQEMTVNVRNSFLDNINRYSWMDSSTKENARQKAVAIKEDIGFPDYIKDPVKLAKETENLNFTDQIFENVVAMIKFSIQRNLASLRKPVNKDKWLLGPSETNGYYSSYQNRIVFLAGILQPPFFSPTYPKYLTYGGIGMVIGHEITHGFDSAGRLFDKDGNFRNWWSPRSSLNFEMKSMCLVEQYNKFTVFGQNVNGSLTINENIADNGGIKVAYEGYKVWTHTHGQEKPLPGLGLTVDQLFFVGFARPWCSIYTKKPALLQLKTDSHSFSKFRIIGTLQNYPKFSEAFKCKKNAPMNPEKKCSVW